MLWKNRRVSSNLSDRRGMGGPVSIGTLLVGAVIYYFMGGNPVEYIAQNSGQMQKQEISRGSVDQKEFVGVILADTEDVWNDIFRAEGKKYREPKLVLFNGIVASACGQASSAVGPFYCPGDEQVYLDLEFFNKLSGSLGAGGDFASAYVIAHEIGHHVQKLLDVEGFSRKSDRDMDEKERNRSSVKIELQADCFAGVWAKRTDSAKNVLEAGDVEEAMNAASAVGDDNLQKQARGHVVPDSFTHGTSEQRMAAFKRGLHQGQVDDCLNF